jgi:DNA repair exonuclease SbcCD nuclease subunit
MKVIFIGDPHFQVSNLIEVDLFIEKMKKLCLEEKPDLIIIAGDLLHTHERLHTVALNKAYEFINILRNISKTIILVGNHDMCNNQQFLTENHWMNAMKEWDNVVIVDKGYKLNIENVKILFVPYVYPGRFVEALNIIDSEWKTSKCIFAHQEFQGCKMGAITSIEGDKWDLKNPQVVSGHIHSRQVPQKNIYYSGSAMQHAFGESEKNVIPIITIEKDKFEINEIDLELSRKKIIYMDVKDLESFKSNDREGDDIKLSICGNFESFKALKKTKKYQELIKAGTKIVFKPTRKEIKINKDVLEKIQQENVQNNSVENPNFDTILYSIILQEKNPFLYQAYEHVLNGKDFNEKTKVLLL